MFHGLALCPSLQHRPRDAPIQMQTSEEYGQSNRCHWDQRIPPTKSSRYWNHHLPGTDPHSLPQLATVAPWWHRDEWRLHRHGPARFWKWDPGPGANRTKHYLWGPINSIKLIGFDLLNRWNLHEFTSSIFLFASIPTGRALEALHMFSSPSSASMLLAQPWHSPPPELPST